MATKMVVTAAKVVAMGGVSVGYGGRGARSSDDHGGSNSNLNSKHFYLKSQTIKRIYINP